MGFKDRLIGAFFGDAIEAKVQERLKAASVIDPLADTEMLTKGWRKLTGDITRNLFPLQQDRMINISFWLWENNPLAHWIIEITKDFIVGEGLPYDSKNEDVKDVLDDFWADPINRMDLYIEKYVIALLICGELCFPIFVAEQTGKVRLGYVDALMIDEAVTDPDNVKLVIGITTKSLQGRPAKRYKAVLPKGAEDILSPAARELRDSFTDGQCFYFAINNVANSPRGRGELLVVADWCDAYEQFLFDYADKWPMLNTFVWDLCVTGGDEDAINKQIKNFTKKSGSIYGHNEKVTLEPSVPDLKSMDAETGARLFRNHILGSKNLPEHWFGGGGNVNLATAVEMQAPTYKALSSKQRYFKYILESIFSFVIDSGRTARYLKVTDEEAAAFSVTTPELSGDDLTTSSTAIQSIATALVSAETQEWIDKGSARKVFISIIGFLGIDLDQTDIEQALTDAQEKTGYEDGKQPKLAVVPKVADPSGPDTEGGDANVAV